MPSACMITANSHICAHTLVYLRIKEKHPHWLTTRLLTAMCVVYVYYILAAKCVVYVYQ